MAGNIRSLWTELHAPTHPHEAVTPNAGFPGGSVSEPSCQCRRCRFNSWVEKIPWIRKCQPTSVFLPGKSHGQRSPVGYSPRGYKRVRHDLTTKQQWYHTTLKRTINVVCMWMMPARIIYSSSPGSNCNQRFLLSQTLKIGPWDCIKVIRRPTSIFDNWDTDSDNVQTKLPFSLKRASSSH